MNHEIYVNRALAETIEGPGTEDEAGREAARQRAVARAYELRGLSYERRNPNWLESDHYEFRCEETPDGEHVRVFAPVGTFLLAARRVKAGEYKTEVTLSEKLSSFGGRAREDQISLPVKIVGRLNAPWFGNRDWTFQPSHFVYEDGTSSDFLGSYPKTVALEP